MPISDACRLRRFCAMPKPAGSLQSQHPLATRAWYELYALAKSDDPAVLDGAGNHSNNRHSSRSRTPFSLWATTSAGCSRVTTIADPNIDRVGNEGNAACGRDFLESGGTTFLTTPQDPRDQARVA